MHTERTPLAGNFLSQYPVAFAAAPRVPKASRLCLKCNKPPLSSHMSQMGNLSLAPGERRGIPVRSVTGNREGYKNMDMYKGKAHGTHTVGHNFDNRLIISSLFISKNAHMIN